MTMQLQRQGNSMGLLMSNTSGTSSDENELPIDGYAIFDKTPTLKHQNDAK
jgi:hypothetical protein